MRRSLTLADRELLALEDAGVTGFAVAQPASLPSAHDSTYVGLLDDLHAHSFGRPLTETGDDLAGAAELLAASERALSARGRTTVLAACPAAWTVERDFLETQGDHTANLWLLKA